MELQKKGKEKKKMRAKLNSILQSEKACLVCETTQSLESHHIFFGANRKISEKNGFKIWLCSEHHRGENGPHFNKKTDNYLKKLCQFTYEKTHTRDDFMILIGRNYLE